MTPCDASAATTASAAAAATTVGSLPARLLELWVEPITGGAEEPKRRGKATELARERAQPVVVPFYAWIRSVEGRYYAHGYGCGCG